MLQTPEQHSPFAAQTASSGWSVQAGCCVVELLFLHPAANASAASADTSSVENLGVRMRPSAGPAATRGALVA